MPAIAVDGLTKRYAELTAVDGIGFEVEVGEVVALLGPNGAGKTTTIEILEGFRTRSGGRVSVLGVDPIRAGREWRARVGLVMQSTSLDSQLTVREALELFAGLFPRPRPASEMLKLIGLEDDADTRIGQLSGGQQRRVDVGLGIIGRPDLLFLDEPTTGLDPAARRQAWDVIQELASGGTTVLLTTHYMEEAQRLARRAIVLSRGRIVADGTPDALRAQSAPTVIRYPLPLDDVQAPLPDVLLAYRDPERRELIVRTEDVTSALEALVGWARENGLELDGLEVGRPTLEDAYLTLTADPAGEELVHHG